MKNAKGTAGMQLDRPIAFFDIESTGTSARADRIIDIAIIKVMTDGTRQSRIWRVNPGIPIPPEVTRIHGIADKDVADAPPFSAVAKEIYDFLSDADLAGYNILRFDIPMLTEEFLRAEIRFNPDDHRVIDAQRIFHKREPRDLAAALAFYCGELHLDAHGAEADTRATIRVLEGELQRYPDLPHTVPELDRYCSVRDPSWADRSGRLRWKDGQIVLNFGRRKGELLRDIIEHDRDFVKWMLRSDFPVDFREIVTHAAEGKWPQPPAATEPDQ